MNRSHLLNIFTYQIDGGEPKFTTATQWRAIRGTTTMQEYPVLSGKPLEQS